MKYQIYSLLCLSLLYATQACAMDGQNVLTKEVENSELAHAALAETTTKVLARIQNETTTVAELETNLANLMNLQENLSKRIAEALARIAGGTIADSGTNALANRLFAIRAVLNNYDLQAFNQIRSRIRALNRAAQEKGKQEGKEAEDKKAETEKVPQQVREEQPTHHEKKEKKAKKEKRKSKERADKKEQPQAPANDEERRARLIARYPHLAQVMQRALVDKAHFTNRENLLSGVSYFAQGLDALTAGDIEAALRAFQSSSVYGYPEANAYARMLTAHAPVEEERRLQSGPKQAEDVRQPQQNIPNLDQHRARRAYQEKEAEFVRMQQRCERFIRQYPRYAGDVRSALMTLDPRQRNKPVGPTDDEQLYEQALRLLIAGDIESVNLAIEFFDASMEADNQNAACYLQRLDGARFQACQRRIDAKKREQQNAPNAPVQALPAPKQPSQPTIANSMPPVPAKPEAQEPPKEKEKKDTAVEKKSEAASIDLKKEKEKEEKPVEEKKEKAHQKCTVCLEPGDIIKLHCGHALSCRDCFTIMVDTALKEHTSAAMRCTNLQCKDRIVTYEDVGNIVDNDPNKLNLYSTILCHESLNGLLGIKQCPTPNCLVRFINDQNIPVALTCPGCKEQYCGLCLIPHGDAPNCGEARLALEAHQAGGATLKAYQENKASETWKKKYSRPCPHCTIDIAKSGGCLYVRCVNCQKDMCWTCGQKWDETGHIGHFVCPFEHLHKAPDRAPRDNNRNNRLA